MSAEWWFAASTRNVGLSTTTIVLEGYDIGRGDHALAFIPIFHDGTVGVGLSRQSRQAGTKADVREFAQLLSAAPAMLALLQAMRDRVRSDEAVRRYGEACEDTPVASFVEEIDAVLTRALGQKA